MTYSPVFRIWLKEIQSFFPQSQKIIDNPFISIVLTVFVFYEIWEYQFILYF